MCEIFLKFIKFDVVVSIEKDGGNVLFIGSLLLKSLLVIWMLVWLKLYSIIFVI